MLFAMRVLLVAPLDPKVPSHLKYLMGGENTYTRTLLKHPPRGVEYVHYLSALSSGAVRPGKLHRLLRFLSKFRLLPLSAGTVDLELCSHFDLVHCHAYTLRLSGQESGRMPVVLGDSVPNRWALRNYFHQNSLRIKAAYAFRHVVHRLANVYDQDLCLGNFKTLIVMSRFAQREHFKIRKTSKRIRVIYPGLPDRGIRLPTADKSVRFLFAGVWFERKGGLIVWEAYRRVRERFGRKVRLTILGPLPNKLKMKSSSFAKATADREKLKVLGIQQHDFVPYERLVGEFYPNADVLVHVPPESEGYGLVVSEAMSFGICPVVSAVGALPEMVIHGKTGMVVKPGIVESLEKALTVLVRNGALRERLGRAARARFLQEFILEKMQKELIEVYQQALSSHSQ